MRRFFIEEIDADSEHATVTIQGTEFRHLKGALRLKPGTEVSLFNGKGIEFEGVVTSVGKFIVQKATELGVKEVIFFTAPRTIPVFDSATTGKKISRWKRVSQEAAKQCGRSILPRIDITDFKSAIKGSPEGLKVLLEKIHAARRGHAGLKGVCRSVSSKRLRAGDRVIVLVGPEGGLTEAEVNAAVKEGFRVFSLGPRTLRAETAAVSALTIIQYELGDMGGQARS
jgi:16S rRNA (uracil1498-N3)-methyltransferase